MNLEELTKEFEAFYGDEENEHQLLTRMKPLIYEVKHLRGVIDYIRTIGRMRAASDASGVFLSIMEKVLTTDEYIEWRSKSGMFNMRILD